MHGKGTYSALLAAVSSLLMSLSTSAGAQGASGPAGETPLETIVITAKRIRDDLEGQRSLTPGGVTVLDGADSFRRHVTNLPDMLRYVPGVWSESSSGADELFLSSRGSNLDATDYDGNGIKLMQDGLPVTTADGNNHNRVLDPLSARYAVIARGANALTYGASTLGGAIDFISPTARTDAPVSVSLNGGSYGSFSGRVTVGGVAGDLDGVATIEAKNWDGYREHSSQQRQGVYANAGWQLSEKVSARVFATYVDNDQELPGALTRAEVDEDPDQASPAAIGGNYQKNVETGRAAAKLTWQIDDQQRVEAGLSYEEQSLYHPIVDKVLVDFDGPGPAPPVEVFSLLVDTDHRDVGAVLRYQAELGAHDLSLGLNYGDGSVDGGNYRNDGGRPNGLSEQVDNSADNLEAYILDRWQLTSDLTLVYGAQYVEASRSVRTTDAASGAVRNPSDDYSSVNPRLGAIYTLSEHNELYASVSRLFEPPTTFELEDDVRGSDATLDAMHGTVYEIGTRSRTSGEEDASPWHWDVSVYYAQIRDEILSIDDPAAPGNSLTTNIDETTHAGVEALFGASMALGANDAHRVEPRLSFTFNDFSFDSDPTYGDNDLPAAPTYVVRGEVLYRNMSGFYAGPTFDLVGERYVDFSNDYRVDSYGLLGMRTGWSSEHWEVFGELRNMLDEDYIATVSVLNRADADARVLYPGGGRSAFVGIRWKQ
jgi:iron complex outermembrane receptor protein